MGVLRIIFLQVREKRTRPRTDATIKPLTQPVSLESTGPTNFFLYQEPGKKNCRRAKNHSTVPGGKIIVAGLKNNSLSKNRKFVLYFFVVL